MVLKLKSIPEDKAANQFVRLMMKQQKWVVGGNFKIDDSAGKSLVEKFPTSFEKVA